MKMLCVQLEIDGRMAEYRAGGEDEEFPSPVLILNVEDYQDAEKLLHKLDPAHPRRKRSTRKEAADPYSGSAVVKPTETDGQSSSTIAPSGDGEGARASGHTEPASRNEVCPAHADGKHQRTGGAACACEPAQPDALTPMPEGRKRAFRIREQVEAKAEPEVKA